MKKLVYTFVSVVGLYGFVPVNGFAQHKQDQVVAQPDTTKQNYHVLDGVEVSTVRKLVSNNTVSSQLTNKTIERSLGQSLGTMLERVSGVSSIQTGEQYRSQLSMACTETVYCWLITARG